MSCRALSAPGPEEGTNDRTVRSGSMIRTDRDGLVQAPDRAAGADSRVFRDPRLNEQFLLQGYVVVSLLDAPDVIELRSLWEGHAPGVTGFYSNVGRRRDEETRRLSARIRDVIGPPLVALLDGYAATAGSFAAKAADDEGALPLHQDWNTVDESRAFGLSAWCPLDHVDDGNGTLRVLPGSHRWFTTVRSITIQPTAIPLDAEIRALTTPLALAPGQAVVHAQNLFHGSLANRSSRMRVAAVCGTRKVGVPMVHYYRDPDRPHAPIEIFEIDPEFFASGVGDLRDGRRPEGLTLLGSLTHPPHEVTRERVVAHASSNGRTR